MELRRRSVRQQPERFCQARIANDLLYGRSKAYKACEFRVRGNMCKDSKHTGHRDRILPVKNHDCRCKDGCGPLEIEQKAKTETNDSIRKEERAESKVQGTVRSEFLKGLVNVTEQAKSEQLPR